MKDENKNKEVPSREKSNNIKILIQKTEKLQEELCCIDKRISFCSDAIERYGALIRNEMGNLYQLNGALKEINRFLLEEIK